MASNLHKTVILPASFNDPKILTCNQTLWEIFRPLQIEVGLSAVKKMRKVWGNIEKTSADFTKEMPFLLENTHE